MQLAHDGTLYNTKGDSFSVYDPERCEYRLTVYEEDGVLRLIISEPVIIDTDEKDLVVRHDRQRLKRTAWL